VNTELRNLLEQAGLAGADDPALWTRALMVHITGTLPQCMSRDEGNNEAGFHLLLMDHDGNAVHRVKCRSVADEGFRRECETMAVLGGDPTLAGLVPNVTTLTSRCLRVHISPEIQGTSYLTTIRKQRVGDWQRTAEDVLGMIHLIGERAKQLIPWLRHTSPELRLGLVLADRLNQLERGGMDYEAIQALRKALDGVIVPSHPQHGDLWPDNILVDRDGHWHIIDFETFGQVQFPLYDALHFAWSSINPAWPDRDKQVAQDAVVQRLARRQGLSDSQVGALWLAFQIELTAHRMRPGAPPAYSQDLQKQLRASARQLASGCALADFAPAARSRTERP
jgi:hypothetical protein